MNGEYLSGKGADLEGIWREANEAGEIVQEPIIVGSPSSAATGSGSHTGVGAGVVMEHSGLMERPEDVREAIKAEQEERDRMADGQGLTAEEDDEDDDSGSSCTGTIASRSSKSEEKYGFEGEDETKDSVQEGDNEQLSSFTKGDIVASPASSRHEESEDTDEEEEEEVEEETEEEEEEDSEDEDEDFDNEPNLKYGRFEISSSASGAPGTSTGKLDFLTQGRDGISALDCSERFLAVGTYNGLVHVFDFQGRLVKRIRPHSANVNDLHIDSCQETVGTAGVDGRVTLVPLPSSSDGSQLQQNQGKQSQQPQIEGYDLKRPMICIALEPDFSKLSTRRFVCGGMAGQLVMHERGWLGNRETKIYGGEGPIWGCEWKENLIAWVSDEGVRIYDTSSSQRIAYIPRHSTAPRPDLYPPTISFSNTSTLLIAWGDQLKIVSVKDRSSNPSPNDATSNGTSGGGGGGALAGLENVVNPFHLGSSGGQKLGVEVSAIFEVDCMIAGVVSYPIPKGTWEDATTNKDDRENGFLILAYPFDEDEPKNVEGDALSNREAQKRKVGKRPEIRIITGEGEEIMSDELALGGYEKYSAKDYRLRAKPLMPSFLGSKVNSSGKTKPEEAYYVISPEDIIWVKKRDRKDHIEWLIEECRYEEALKETEKSGLGAAGLFDVVDLGKKYLRSLVDNGQYSKAATTCLPILGKDAKAWEDWIFLFAEKDELQTIIPVVPTHEPQLSRLVYEMILAHFLRHSPEDLLTTIKAWPHEIYDVNAVILATRDRLEREPSSSDNVLMECLSELYTMNHQPGKALPYFLRLRRPGVFDLIRDYNLFTDIQDQVVLLLEFDEDLSKRRRHKQEGTAVTLGSDWDVVERDAGKGKGKEVSKKLKHGAAIDLLVDHTHSIPIPRVVSQLQNLRLYLYRYLDALFDKDPHLGFEYSDLQVELYAEFQPPKMMDFLRASNYYSLEKAYNVCNERNLVPEMVFLLGRTGDNKKALMIIIERLGDVDRAIEFAKEQNDHDLWEDLLGYAETKPAIIRKLLENIGAEIDPIRLIRRIKHGLEIPGLRDALIKVLQDFNLQMSLLEGCKTVLYSDCRNLALKLHDGQTNGLYCNSETRCHHCRKIMFSPSSPSPTRSDMIVVFLCRHAYHVSCACGPDVVNALSREVETHAGPSGLGRIRGTRSAMSPSSLALRLGATLKAQKNSGGGRLSIDPGTSGECPRCREGTRVR